MQAPHITRHADSFVFPMLSYLTPCINMAMRKKKSKTQMSGEKVFIRLNEKQKTIMTECLTKCEVQNSKTRSTFIERYVQILKCFLIHGVPVHPVVPFFTEYPT